MNDTVTLGRLAEMMASSAAIDKSLAEKFIKAFFAHIEDSLAVSVDVSINDLGTFSRSSNTDNPIEFTPANTFVDALNEPFEMFAPVPIGDAELDGQSNLQKDVDDTLVNKPNSETTEDVISIKNEEILEPAAPESENQALLTSDSGAVLYNDIPVEHDNNEDPMRPADDIDAKYEIDQNRKRSYMWVWMMLVLLIGLFLGGVAGYFGHDWINNAFYALSDSDDLTIVDQAISDMPQDTAIEAVTDSMTCDTINGSDKALELERAEIYDTVTPQRFLTTMARKYYGQMEYWVFIYDANSDILHDPNRIKPGTKVRIPELSEFSQNETPEKTLERAKYLGREIYARYHE